jgi:hypothetical protein
MPSRAVLPGCGVRDELFRAGQRKRLTGGVHVCRARFELVRSTHLLVDSLEGVGKDLFASQWLFGAARKALRSHADLDQSQSANWASKVDGLLMWIGSAAGRHERLGGDQPRPFAQERPRAVLALADKVPDMRGRAINLTLVVERLLQLVRHFTIAIFVFAVIACAAFKCRFLFARPNLEFPVAAVTFAADLKFRAAWRVCACSECSSIHDVQAWEQPG